MKWFPHVRITVTRLMTTLVILWLQTAGAQQVTFRLPDDDPNTNSDVIRSAAFSPDGLLLAVGYGRFTGMLQEPRPGQAVLWDARSGSRKVTIRGRTDGVCSVAFSRTVRASLSQSIRASCGCVLSQMVASGSRSRPPRGPPDRLSSAPTADGSPRGFGQVARMA